MHLYRTRPYLLGKNLWAAVTARFTQLTGSNDYRRVGEQIKQRLRFGYLYLCEEDQVLLPRFARKGLKYGNMAQYDFERRYLHVLPSTAIESSSLTADDESLHEVEVVNPWRQGKNHVQRSILTGFLWLRPEYVKDSGFWSEVDKNEIRLCTEAHQWPLDEVVHDLQLGGERRYGFGKIRIKGKLERLQDSMRPFPGRMEGMGNQLQLVLQENDAIWAHAEVDGANCMGDVEAVVGRDWHNEKGAGRHLVQGKLYWVPGSIVRSQTIFTVDPMGFWKSTEMP